MITAPELARRIADQLEHLGVPYAVGGSLALAVWGFPRATNDVDIDLFVDAEGLDAVLIVLRDEGMTLDIPEAKRSAAERGDFRGYVEGMRIDFFVPCIPLYESARDRVRVAPLLGRPARFLSAEDLATFKMLFFRSKDIVDIERLVAFGAGNSIAPTSDRGWCKPSARRTNASADGTAWCGTSNRAVHSSGVSSRPIGHESTRQTVPLPNDRLSAGEGRCRAKHHPERDHGPGSPPSVRLRAQPANRNERPGCRRD